MAKKRTGQGGIQTALPGIEWAVCACGCGQSFVQGEKGRKREYLNDSHKKRAYRRRVHTNEENDAYCAEMWAGWSEAAIAQWINDAPDSFEAWSGQWELNRRAR